MISPARATAFDKLVAYYGQKFGAGGALAGQEVFHPAGYITDAEVVEAFQLLSRSEGIIPALEPAHALAWIVRAAPDLRGQTVLMNLSGRGDKDVAQMMDVLKL